MRRTHALLPLAVLSAALAMPAAACAQSTSVVVSEIAQIQGASHTSPFSGQTVTTSGVVTTLARNGYWIQDPTPDGSDATSDAVFVFTSSAPTVRVGDELEVEGRVTEFRPGGSSTDNLTTTELTGPRTAVVARDATLPPATVIGRAGRVPPPSVIEDDAFASFDAGTDGIDFYESLEGMRVRVDDAVAVGPTSRFGEIPVVGDASALAGPDTTRGGLHIGPSDYNPERIQVDDALAPAEPRVDVGDAFAAPVVGVLDYSFGNYKLFVTAWPAVIDGGLRPETTTGAREKGELAVATYNVENLDPGDADRFPRIAEQIVGALRSPDILALGEVQDDNGPVNDSTVGASGTYRALITAIEAAGGPSYEFRQIDPVDDSDGGQPGGNIRVGFLFRTDRDLEFIDRPGGTATAATTIEGGTRAPQLSFSPGRVDPDNPAWKDSRKPLAGEFSFRGRRLFMIANHFNSKGGDDPLFGRIQPPQRSSERQRHAQAASVNGFVDQILARDPRARVIVLGDFNDFQFSETLDLLEGGALTNLIDTLPERERYSYVYEGNSQTLDHQLVSPALAGVADYDVVHVNSEFADALSDHDPGVAVFALQGPGSRVDGATRP